jgi:hypothetical protein
MKVVHVAARLLHEHALNQLASGATVTLPDIRRSGDLPERLLEFCYEQFSRLTMFAPPAVFGLEPLLGLIEQDDLHAALDTGPGIPTRPSPARRRNRRAHDPKRRAVRHALRPSTRHRLPAPRLRLRLAKSSVRPEPADRSSLGSCVRAWVNPTVSYPVTASGRRRRRLCPTLALTMTVRCSTEPSFGASVRPSAIGAQELAAPRAWASAERH